MTRATAATADRRMTTCTYRVVVEPDDDVWHAYCPALQGYGGVTSGKTRAEALRHIREVVAMIVAELLEDGETLAPDEAGSRVRRPPPPSTGHKVPFLSSKETSSWVDINLWLSQFSI